jgi:hypothetical protein
LRDLFFHFAFARADREAAACAASALQSTQRTKPAGPLVQIRMPMLPIREFPYFAHDICWGLCENVDSEH